MRKRALVTGGSRGIGLAVADVLATEGAHVAIAARGGTGLAQAVEQLAQEGLTVFPIVADTRDVNSVAAMVDQTVDELGGIDVLVNAAAQPAGAAPPLTGLSDDALRDEIETKVLGYLRCARAVAPLMAAQGWGRIINVSGLNARRTGSLIGSVRNVAVAAMTKNLADELGQNGINVTVVHPGPTVTERTAPMIADMAREQDLGERQIAERLAEGTTIGRLVAADEVASVIAFLASPQSVAITGDAIAVGGGARGAIHY